jgi:hypothetical protein
MGDMNFLDWIPAISTSSLLAFALWLMRSVISTRLTKSVQHEFDTKLEILRAELRKNEESFKSELRAKDAQIELLRSGAMSGLASRQAALDKRRIEAVDQLWSAVIELAPAKSASATMSVIIFEEAAKEAAKNPKFRQMFETLGGNLDFKQFQGTSALKVRPFVSDMSWAIFSAYQAILLFAVSQIQMLKTGLDAPKILNIDAVSKLVQTAMPHYTEYLSKYGSAGFHYLLDELESRLLKELQNILKGEESDKASIEEAAVILKESERLMETISSAASK